MFRTTLCTVVLSAVSFISNAVETLDVLVVFDQNTINNYSNLNTSSERTIYAQSLVYDLNRTMANSGLSQEIRFNLVDDLYTRFSHMENGQRANIVQIAEKYKVYGSQAVSSKKPNAPLFFLQKAHNADVVIGVSVEDANNVSNYQGMVIDIPSNRNIGISETSSDVMETAPFGVFFISAKDETFTNPRLAAHEFGHTAGLFHLPVEPVKNGDDIDHTSDWIVHGAAGYKHEVDWGIDRTTVMVNSYNASFSTGKENQYSDINNHTCGKNDNLPCGDVNSNAVQTIRTFAADINKRGNWYQ